MIFTDFTQSFNSPTPPAELSEALKSLWWDGKGNWDKAHNIAQEIEDTQEGAWVHAYLHRKEGDRGNAGYWYRRAGKPFPDISLEKEWEEISRELLR